MNKITAIRELEADKIRASASAACETLDWISDYVVEGVKTESIAKFCRDYLFQVKKIPAYDVTEEGDPVVTVYVSHNYIIAGGKPSSLRLQHGDIINVELKIQMDNCFSESSRMYMIGKPSPQKIAMVEAAFEAMSSGLEAVRPGATTGDVGHAIYTTISKMGFHTLINDSDFTERPAIPHLPSVGRPGEGIKLETGMTFILEPIIISRCADVERPSSRSILSTSDCSPTAHWKHIIAVTDEGCEVLTQPTFHKDGLLLSCIKPSQMDGMWRKKQAS